MPIFIYIFSPRPKIDQTDALVNEIDLIYKDSTYEKIFLYPKMGLAQIIPYQWWGLFWVFFNRTSLNKKNAVHHLYVNRLCYFSFLNWIDAPVSISLNTTLKNQNFNSQKLDKYKTIFVQSDTDQDRLSQKGLTNVAVLTPAFPDFKIESSYLEPTDKFHILSASGPWKKSQIKSKGFELLLQVLKESDQYKLSIVLRNYYLKEINALVKAYGVKENTLVVDGKIEIQKYLDLTHCTVLIVNDPLDIKAYPHSLLESLKAHKPVIISDNIAMADFVSIHKVGIVVNEFTATAINKALNDLRNEYAVYVEHTKKIPWEKYNHKTRKDQVFTNYDLSKLD